MKRKLAGLGLILVLLMSTMSFASASSAGFTTERFDVEVNITEDHVMSFTEKVKVDFYEARHGIFRYIPYDAKTYDVKHASALGDPYESYTEDGNVVLQIGDPYETIQGGHTYQMQYDLVCYEDRDDAVDYLSLDVIPPEWQTRIETAQIVVHFPKPIDADKVKIFSGIYGFEGNDIGVEPVFSNDGKTMTINADNLQRGQAITIAAELPEGYWVDEANRDWMMIPLVCLLCIVPLITFILWFIFGRDPKMVKTVEFYAPDGMTPAEIGYVADGIVNNKDLSAMIVYFAEKGYLEIREYDEDKFELIKKTSIPAEEKRFAKTLFNAYFMQSDVVKMDELPEDIADFYEVATSQVSALYRGEKKLHTASSTICRVAGIILYALLTIIPATLAAMMSFSVDWVIAIVPIVVTALIGAILLIVGYDNWNSMSKGAKMACVVAGISLLAVNHVGNGIVLFILLEKIWVGLLSTAALTATIVFVTLMQARTTKSTVLMGKILGFRDFIETAELEKLKLMVEENPNYFYDIMPYAYVFGLSDKWIKHFEQIPTAKPGWYHGHRHIDAWDVYWYSRMMNRCMTSMDHSISSAIYKSMDTGGGSIGGGFGGGGFSGGGFGGGGGGSW